MEETEEQLSWVERSPSYMHVHPAPRNTTPFGNKVFADVIKLKEGHAEFGWALNSTLCLYKKIKGHIDPERQSRRSHDGGSRNVLHGMTHAPAKESPRMVPSCQSWGETMSILPEVLQGSTARHTWTGGSSCHIWEKRNSCLSDLSLS